jgi:hypothetical protein
VLLYYRGGEATTDRAPAVDCRRTAYENVVGALPSDFERDFYVGLLQGSRGTMTQAELLMFAANSEANAINIDIVGLQQSGVEFV